MSNQNKENQVIVIGASAAGLATAACLKKQNIPFVLLERHAQVGYGWRNHYDRLHLHTNKNLSELPYKKFDSALPKYPPRQAVVDYLDNYRQEMDLQPIFNTEVRSVKKVGSKWLVSTNNGDFSAQQVVVATGQTNQPKLAEFAGMESFPGKILHSSAYKNGAPYKGQRVLVVGFGNSGCEIALDLQEHGSLPALSVRSAVNVLPRDILGIPILQLSLIMNVLPPRLADRLNAPLIRLLVGNLEKVGLRKSPLGPMEQIQKEKRIPLLDVGTMKLLRQGKIKAYQGIRKIEGENVIFTDGQMVPFDAMVLATGYSNELEKFVQVEASRFDDLNQAVEQQKFFGKDGLYFCGFYIAPTGMLREIGLDAQKIAAHIAQAGKG